MQNPEVLQRISQETRIPIRSIEAAIGLLEAGATVPFIARYRKEATNNLDEVQIRAIDEKRAYHSQLIDRKSSILQNVAKLGKLTDELRDAILAAPTKSALEDLYLPYRSKKKTRAAAAVERGLEPLANYIQDQFGSVPVESFALGFINQERGVPDAQSAIRGALDILAERLAESAVFRQDYRKRLETQGVVKAQAAEGKESEKTKYETYYKFEESVQRIPSHRMLAVRRGNREKILNFKIEADPAPTIESMIAAAIKDRGSLFVPHLEAAVRDAFDRLIEPAIENEVRGALRERSEAEAIRVFEENLRSLLMAPPAGPITVMGVDPGQKTGSKAAVVDPTGKFLEHQVLFVAEPKKDIEAATAALLDLIQKHSVRGIAIGNGTGSREAEDFIRDVIAQNNLDVFCIVVNESGASVYSASKRAREEFGSLDITVRGAISIARRLQDPLAELVKIEPRSIGVGQYQHDVDQKKLRSSLLSTIESCVNAVGVVLNTASADLLRYVSGIGEKISGEIVAYRDQNGPFRTREQLLQVPGFNARTYEYAAGFLRIKDGDCALDATAVHPESYAHVEKIAAQAGVPVAALIGDSDKIKAIDFSAFEAEAGKFTLADIRDELLRPGRDPRSAFAVPRHRADVRDIANLTEGMELEGRVTNVTNFGAFVDLGVHQDGLVHISEVAHRFVRDARSAVRVGDVVKVRVIGVDQAAKRISLSMKALEAPPPKPERPAPRPARREPRGDAPSGRPGERPSNAADAAAAGSRPGPARHGRPGGDDRSSARPQPDRRRPSGPGPQRVQREGRETKVPVPPKPAEPAGPELSMEEKIKLLQQKFKGTR